MTTQHTPRSAVFGKFCTHVRQRDDAIIHNGRDYVPTIYGQPEGNTVWVDSLEQLRKVGGSICFNEDQTEIHLTLPVGHKFGIQMFDKERAAPDLLEAARSLVGVFEGQEDVPQYVQKARVAIAKVEGR